MEVPTDQIPAGWFAEPASERLVGLPRTGSSSRLNAQAPEFVPRGPPPPPPTVVLPPPSQAREPEAKMLSPAAVKTEPVYLGNLVGWHR
ncbi:hypothetical protein ACJX0J_027397, partial [Zea mays]